MVTAREIDAVEEEYVQRGDAFFHVSGAGHESAAVLNPHLAPADWLHCHYRDKALMLARGIDTEMFFYSLFAKDASDSKGRQMNAHMSSPDHNIMSLVGPVGNNVLQAAGVAMEIRDTPGAPIVVCSIGDGTSQQGEALEGIAEAVRWQLPVLFLVEDNSYSISTKTHEKTFFSLPGDDPDTFYGLKVQRISGRCAESCYDHFGAVVQAMRADRKPALVVMTTERLSSHTNADDHDVYRTAAEIERACSDHDPIPILETYLIKEGCSTARLCELREQVKRDVRAAATLARRSPDPSPAFDAKRPLLPELLAPRSCGIPSNGATTTMREAIRDVLHRHMQCNARVTLYGEDIEDPKGDVFGVTRGLTETFPDQVQNSPLTESTIIGVSIGRALAGGRPVAFLQFADFLPLAYNQIISELGSMYWRTNGGWQCPVIVMITCGGYRPGLGPFHAQTLESVAAHTPGIDVFMPSAADDAAGLLNFAFESNRPTLFFYPKSCLNERSPAGPDLATCRTPAGVARVLCTGADMTFVAWGNTVKLCRNAAEILNTRDVESTVIDLRSLSPWDEDCVLRSVRQTRKLLVAHEDNKTCGMGAEILATVAEKAGVPVEMVRVARSDTYVPFHFANQLEVLPSFKEILTRAASLFDLDIEWEKADGESSDVVTVEAIGASPADESVTVASWLVKEGDTVAEGQELASVETDKSSVEIVSPVTGDVAAILVPEGGTVKVGTPLLKIHVDGAHDQSEKPLSREMPGTPVFTSRPRPTTTIARVPASATRQTVKIGIRGVGTATGSRRVDNEELAATFSDKSAADIFRGTGILSRYWIGPEETALSLAVTACRQVLEARDLDVPDLDMIICCTGTPGLATPSLACRILHALAPDGAECPAYDILAACSGYLYGLQAAYNFLQEKPGGQVLLITSEVLSEKLDPNDFNTAIIFGDAATATLVCGGDHNDFSSCRVHLGQPVLSATGESGALLRLPLDDGHIAMDGSKVFSEGVRKMIRILKRACKAGGIAPAALDLIIPHQANSRIINAIRNRLELPEDRIYTNIENLGNTSSSTIPLCLADLLDSAQTGQTWGLTAFGGGFTYGACLMYID